MSLLHNHRFVEVARTYAPPIAGLQSAQGGQAETVERLLHGCTTICWKCSDETCGEIKTVVMLGRVT